MLTGDLLRVKVSAKRVTPSFVDDADEAILAEAGSLMALFEQAAAEAWPRRAIAEALAEQQGDDPRHKLHKGLAKVLLDQCDFACQSPIPPEALRQRVFLRAAAAGPLLLKPSPTGGPTANSVLQAIAAELPPLEDGQPWSAEALGRALYADHKDEQQLTAYSAPADPQALLRRYNLSLAQSCLLRARSMRLRLEAPAPGRARQLFRFLKFFQLLYTLSNDEDGALIVEVDGPQSLLTATTRYGMQLATFLPALPLQPGPWSIEAELAWGKNNARKSFSLDEGMGLHSHYQDTGAWQPRPVTWLVERWAELDSGWAVRPADPIRLGGQGLMVPDLSFSKGGREAHVEVLGYWRAAALKERLENSPNNVILAVSKRLCGEKTAAAEAAGRVLPFAEIISAKALLERVERLAVPGG